MSNINYDELRELTANMRLNTNSSFIQQDYYNRRIHGFDHEMAINLCWRMAYIMTCENAIKNGEDQPLPGPYTLSYGEGKNIWENVCNLL